MKPVAFQDLETLARTIWGEARGEPQAGKVAVAHVILNRRRSGRWYGGATIEEVCRRPYQFSCWNENDPNLSKMQSVDLNDGPLRLCVLVALEAIAGTTSDPTKGATHYHASDMLPPPWAATGTLVAEIGRHLFYRDVA